MNDYVWPESFQPKVVRKAYGIKLCSFTICLEAWRRGLDVEIYDPIFKRFSISDGHKKVKFNRSRSELTSRLATRLIINKQLTREFLLKNGVPVPAGNYFTGEAGLDDALKLAKSIGYPIVIKPLNGSLGNGVFTNVATEEEVRDTYLFIVNELNYNNVILEEFIAGDDYRAYVVGDKAVGVVKRVPANIVGNGTSTIRELIDIKNKNRKKNPFLSKGLIKVDKEVYQYLENASLTLDSVLEKEKLLYLRGKANASAGGDVVDVTNDIPSTVKQAAVKAVKAIPGLSHCGVDILFDSKKNVCHVIEINSRPHIGVNMYPSTGCGQDIPCYILNEHFPGTSANPLHVGNDIIFDMNVALKPLENKVFKSIVLARPEIRYSDFKKLYFELEGVEIDQNIASSIQACASENSILGFFEKRNKKYMLVACGNDDDLNNFFLTCNNFFPFAEARKKKWVGSVSYSFNV